MEKILLYYIFTPLPDPEALRLWQKTLCQKLNLKGRILLSEQGINGTVGGDLEDLKTYVKETKGFGPFKTMQFKWSDGRRDDFPKLIVKVRPEIVTFGVPQEITVDKQGIVGSGKHLKPKQVHELLQKHGDEVVFFDGRNDYEAAVGKFKNARVANVQNTRDFIKELETDTYDDIKSKPVVTYCTGGIRCEVLSTLMKNRGFQEVYQIEGGIANYGKTYGDSGLWEGALYVFDDRVTTKFTSDATDIGRCVHCDQLTSNYQNCSDKQCNKLVLICNDCNARLNRSLCDHHAIAQTKNIL